MKKMMLVFALLFTFAGTSHAIDFPTDIGEIKSVKGGRQSEPSRVYKLVRYADEGNNTATISSGTAVVYDTVSDDGVTIGLSTTAGSASFAGIAVTSIYTSDTSGSTSAADDEGRRNWGYIIVHGPTTANTTSGADGTAGDAFYISGDSGKVGKAPVLTSATTVSVARSGGFFMDTFSAATSVDVFVVAE